jgi:hypothetical protein
MFNFFTKEIEREIWRNTLYVVDFVLAQRGRDQAGTL